MMENSRFIPAPAGNTSQRIRIPLSSPVHPRACGEHALKKDADAYEGGSSPRLRGTPGIISPGECWTRFIPAPAGNTAAMTTLPAESSVHPRACGEHFCSASRSWLESGSSPRLRGTRDDTCRPVDHRRFIPAPAGKHAWQQTPVAGA